MPSGRLLKLSEPLDWCNSSFPTAVTGGAVFSPPVHRIGTKQDSGRWEGGLGLQAFLEYLLALGPAAGGGAGPEDHGRVVLFRVLEVTEHVV